jgi:hypothetical protein
LLWHCFSGSITAPAWVNHQIGEPTPPQPDVIGNVFRRDDNDLSES